MRTLLKTISMVTMLLVQASSSHALIFPPGRITAGTWGSRQIALTGTQGDQGKPQMFIPVRKFRTERSGTLENIVQGEWQTGTVTQAGAPSTTSQARYRAVANRHLARSYFYTVGRHAFLQLDLSRLRSVNNQSIRVRLTGTGPGCGYELWASNRAGCPGSLVMSGPITADTARVGVPIPDCGSHRYYSVSGSNASIEMLAVMTRCPGAARPLTLHPLNIAAFGAVMGLSSLTFLRRRSSLRSRVQ